MAKLGSYRRIYKQDYKPEIQDTIDTLSITVNDSFDGIYNAFNNNITFADNINCTIASFTVTVGSNGAPLNATTIKLNNFQKTVIGIIPINVTASNTNNRPNAGVNIGYTINNALPNQQNNVNKSNPLTITVTNISGLPSGQEFTINAIIV